MRRAGTFSQHRLEARQMKQVLKVVKVAMIPLVAVGLIAWFSMPNVEADPPKQDGTKCGPGVGCPENVCCGQITS